MRAQPVKSTSRSALWSWWQSCSGSQTACMRDRTAGNRGAEPVPLRMRQRCSGPRESVLVAVAVIAVLVAFRRASSLSRAWIALMALLTITPGLGPHYLIWPLPIATAAGEATSFYSVAAKGVHARFISTPLRCRGLPSTVRLRTLVAGHRRHVPNAVARVPTDAAKYPGPAPRSPSNGPTHPVGATRPCPRGVAAHWVRSISSTADRA